MKYVLVERPLQRDFVVKKDGESTLRSFRRGLLFIDGGRRNAEEPMSVLGEV